MKRILMAAALALLATTASAAQMSKPVYLFKGGNWETYVFASNDAGIPMCGMQTAYNRATANTNTNMFYVKWTTDGLAIQAGKFNWHLPKDAKVSWRLTLLKTEQDYDSITTQHGWVSSTGSSIYMRVADEDTDKFLQTFAEANGARVTFLEGNEPPWEMSMEGSRKAAVEFMKCVQYVKQTYRSTSPVAKSTSPIKPTSPMPPVQPTDDRKRATKDDGSV